MWLGVLRALAKFAEVLQGLSCPLVGALVVVKLAAKIGPLGSTMVHQVAKTVALATILDLKSCLWVLPARLEHSLAFYLFSFYSLS